MMPVRAEYAPTSDDRSDDWEEVMNHGGSSISTTSIDRRSRISIWPWRYTCARGARGGARDRAVVVLMSVLALAGCDFDVTNPGPVPDSFLGNPDAAGALVNGAHRAFNDTWNEIARVMGSVTREIFPSGNTGTVGINVNERQGILLIDDQDDKWNLAHNARWSAEDALRRFEKVEAEGIEVPDEAVAEAHLWAGYANRMLGENFCEAVIDGSDLQPHTVYLERAEQQFTQAMELAAAAGNTTFELAALGGLASVQVNLEKWAEARVSAQALLDRDAAFVFETPFSPSEQDEYNAVFFSSENEPYRVHTTWNTFYEDYYADTGDPRTPWITVPDFPQGGFGVGPFGTVPWLPQRKYASRSAAADLTDAREMKLILAEAALVLEQDWQTAMQLINEVRTSVNSATTGEPLDAWQVTAGNELADAWTFLMRERGIELWLEARRAGDRRRWAVSDDEPWNLAVPGQLDVHELPSTSEPEHERGAGTYLAEDMDICFPVPDSERETNPSVPMG